MCLLISIFTTYAYKHGVMLVYPYIHTHIAWGISLDLHCLVFQGVRGISELAAFLSGHLIYWCMQSMCICVHIYTYIYLCIYIHTYIFAYASIYLCIVWGSTLDLQCLVLLKARKALQNWSSFTWLSDMIVSFIICVYLCIYTHLKMYIYIYICVCIYTYAYIYIWNRSLGAVLLICNALYSSGSGKALQILKHLLSLSLSFLSLSLSLSLWTPHTVVSGIWA